MNTPNVLIGLPIYKREWILPFWLERIENQTHPLANIGFVFLVGPDDEGTLNLLLEWHMNHPEVLAFDFLQEDSRPHQAHEEDDRSWNIYRYINMAMFRNYLLEAAAARADEFDYYFSLDSDLLLDDPQTIEKLIKDCQDPAVGVVSPLAYMSPVHCMHPNFMTWRGTPGREAIRDLSQFKLDSFYEVDIAMAAVFMTKEVFTSEVRYWAHKQGEDLGFAQDLKDKGFTSYLDTRIYVPHIMHQSKLKQYLVEGDVRKPQEMSTI